MRSNFKRHNNSFGFCSYLLQTVLRRLLLLLWGRGREVGGDLGVEVVRGAARGRGGGVEAGADAGAGPEGGVVLRVEDLDRALLSDPVAHLGEDGQK